MGDIGPLADAEVTPGALCRTILRNPCDEVAAAIRLWCGSRLQTTEVRQALEAIVARLADG